MVEGDKIRPKVKDLEGAINKIKDLGGKIDRKALAGAVGLMLLSWGALPIVYWLIVRKKGDKKEKENDNKN